MIIYGGRSRKVDRAWQGVTLCCRERTRQIDTRRHLGPFALNDNMQDFNIGKSGTSTVDGAMIRFQSYCSHSNRMISPLPSLKICH